MAKRKTKWKKWIVILVIAIVLLVGYLYISKNTQATLSGYAKSAILEETVKIDTIEAKTSGNGVIEPNKRFEVYSTYPGEVKEQYVGIGETLKKDNKLFKVGDFTIKAPIGGTLITTNISEGDYLNQATLATKPVAVLADMSKVKFNLEIDELEINKVQIGMEAKVTADAVTGREYIGKVSKISLEGKNINGISTYQITVEIEDYEGLQIGMNVDATLVLERKENILIVPMTAINKLEGEIYVYVKDETYTGEEPVFYTAPTNMSEVAGYKKQVVKVGTNNKDYIEITEGLKEGDKIYHISNTKSITEYMMENAGGSGGGMMMNIGR